LAFIIRNNAALYFRASFVYISCTIQYCDGVATMRIVFRKHEGGRPIRR